MSERRSLRGALKWAFAMSWGQRLMAMVFTVVLASLLGPRVYGIVAIALVFIAFVQVFLEQGLTTAVIQREDLEPEHLDAAFWMNLGWGIVLALVAAGLSIPLAAIMNVPELQQVVMVLSASLALTGLTQIQAAVLQRAMNFKVLAIRTNVAMFVSGVVGVTLALQGAGVWSLVAQQLTYDLASIAVLWTATSWRPRRRFSVPHARELIGFSLGVFFANLGGFVNRRADALIVGGFFGPAVVGVYRLADRFVEVALEMTMRPIGAVALPLFSRQQDDPAALRAAVEKTLRLAFTVTVPLLLVLAACSPWVLAVVGEEWVIGATALKLLCVVGIVKGLVFFTGPLLFAVGRPRLRAGVLWSLAGISVVSSLVACAVLADVGPARQLTGLSASRALVFVLAVLPLNLWAVSRVTDLEARRILPWLRTPLLAGGGALLVGFGLERTGVLDDVPALAAAAVAGLLTGAVAIGLLLATDRTVRAEATRARRRLRSRRAAHHSSAA